MKKIISIVAIVVLLLNVIPPVMSSSAQEITTTSSSSPFVQASGIQFTVDGHPFYFAGANSYDLFTYGDGWNTATTDAIETKFMDKAGIDNTMSQMAEDGVTVLRTWGFSNETWHGFETSKGVYNEAEFMLFDYIMYSAKQHGIKVIITLENYWEAYGGIDKKLAWEGLSGVSHTGRAQFFVNENCKENYKAYAEHFINRINHYTGVAYKDDPTIFAWDLMNEPRYQDATVNENATGTSLRAWVDEMGSYIKSIDKNHMVCVGLEGHEAKYGFGGNEGNPFVYIQQSPYIDFCSAHPYPDEGWAGLSPEQTKTLMKMWIDDAHNVVGKPFICGEFNTHGNKDLYWAAVFGTIEEEGAAGGLFWEYNYRRLSDFTVMHGDSILTYFKGFSDRMAAKNGTNTTPTIAPTVAPTVVPTIAPTIAPTVVPTVVPTIAPTIAPTVAPTTVPTITPTPTIPSTTGLTLKTTTNQWDSGYQINMSIVNTSSSTINGWTLKLKKSEFSISNAWCVNLKEDGDYLVITPLSWNSSIQAGQSVDFGFQGTGKVITNFTYILN